MASIKFVKRCVFSGGLGNQMFQYAFVLALRDNGFLVEIDTSLYPFTQMHNGYELDRVFDIKETKINKQGFHLYWLRFLNKLKPSSLCTVDNFLYNINALTYPKMYLIGYWQNECYFKKIEDKVRNAFVFQGISIKNARLAKEMRETNSISLHIRRGDYSRFGMTILGEGFYQKAVEKMLELVEHPFFYIFTDDIEEAERIVKKLNIKFQIVCHNRNYNAYQDMYLMSQCRHNIIANSSFSWWGAWLNSNFNKIIIAPKIWSEKTPSFKPQLKEWILI